MDKNIYFPIKISKFWWVNIINLNYLYKIIADFAPKEKKRQTQLKICKSYKSNKEEIIKFWLINFIDVYLFYK